MFQPSGVVFAACGGHRGGDDPPPSAMGRWWDEVAVAVGAPFQCHLPPRGRWSLAAMAVAGGIMRAMLRTIASDPTRLDGGRRGRSRRGDPASLHGGRRGRIRRGSTHRLEGPWHRVPCLTQIQVKVAAFPPRGVVLPQSFGFWRGRRSREVPAAGFSRC